MKRNLTVLALLLSLASFAGASDIPITPTGPVFQIQPALTWGTSGPGGFNNNFFFTPINVNESVCVYVYNNNTTNPHPFTASITITGNPTEQTPADGTWQSASFSNLFAVASPGQPAGIGGLVSGAAKVAISFTNSTTLGGSPETASVTIVQTSGNCHSGQNMIFSAPGTVASMPSIQALSEGLSQAYYSSSGVVTNPAINQVLLYVNAGLGSRSVYFYKTSVECSATCTLAFSTITNLGNTCTSNATVAPIGMKLSVVNNSTSIQATAPCVSNPASNDMFILDLAANTPYDFDPSGLIAPANSSNGFEVRMFAALAAGTVKVSMRWYEK
jgi:hypothetical protein